MIALALFLAGVQDMSGVPIAGSREDAERAMAAFARCEVKSASGRAAALAFTREVEGTPSDYPQRLKSSSCAARGTSLSFRPTLFRLALFPALYARDYGKAAPVEVAALPAGYQQEFDGAPSEQTLVLRRFGDCVVQHDTAGSRTLVLSALYSPEEASAIGSLQPALSQCVAAGQQLHFSRSTIRGAVGEALYKSTAAAAATKAN